ncbi:putative Mitotic checkpoint regulator, MAD2B-interacting-domain-containing protein [Seiridium cardinale]
MALVDYSDSESDSEPVAQPAAKTAPTSTTTSTTAKKPVQKVVDRSNPRRIVVNLGATSEQEKTKPEANSDEPPAKRARTGGGVFGGFASLLPPPKNRVQQAAQSSSSTGKAPPRVGINLKTGATPGFSRRSEGDEADEDGGADSKQPSIPEGQKPAEEVKLVGKPLMFKPLSVSRKPKKNTAKAYPTPKDVAAARGPAPAPSLREVKPQEEAPRKKVSLFSIAAEPVEVPDATASNGVYQPMFTEDTADATDDFAAYDAQYSGAFSEPASAAHAAPTTAQSNDLESIASGMNLDATARRELFGRSGAPAPSQSASRVINFNTDQEYAHNEALRASGEQQIFNPVRAIAPGKHSLQQLVNQVHNQKDALEESFAKSRSNQQEAGQRYGWR